MKIRIYPSQRGQDCELMRWVSCEVGESIIVSCRWMLDRPLTTEIDISGLSHSELWMMCSFWSSVFRSPSAQLYAPISSRKYTHQDLGGRQSKAHKPCTEQSLDGLELERSESSCSGNYMPGTLALPYLWVRRSETARRRSTLRVYRIYRWIRLYYFCRPSLCVFIEGVPAYNMHQWVNVHAIPSLLGCATRCTSMYVMSWGRFECVFRLQSVDRILEGVPTFTLIRELERLPGQTNTSILQCLMNWYATRLVWEV